MLKIFGIGKHDPSHIVNELRRKGYSVSEIFSDAKDKARILYAVVDYFEENICYGELITQAVDRNKYELIIDIIGDIKTILDNFSIEYDVILAEYSISIDPIDYYGLGYKDLDKLIRFILYVISMDSYLFELNELFLYSTLGDLYGCVNKKSLINKLRDLSNRNLILFDERKNVVVFRKTYSDDAMYSSFILFYKDILENIKECISNI